MMRREKKIIKLLLIFSTVITIFLIINTRNPASVPDHSRVKTGRARQIDQVEKVDAVLSVSKSGSKEKFKDLKKPLNEASFTSQGIYENLSFVEIDGGVWKQGFNITYDPRQWNAGKKLNVIIVPHSHNDPGWLKTFEQYFQNFTKHILDNIVQALDEKPTRTFIWAEMSYLSLWWTQANETMRSRMRNLIVNTKQLEIVTGGWVMTDEANSFYYAMIEQMIEGHEWLRANVDASVRPRYGWSIDPFGYTPTMAYLLKRMGFDGMLIQRVNYHVKKYMAQNQRLEFNWRQSWSRDETSDIFCHTMPFQSYIIKDSCGPDMNICARFDFFDYTINKITEKNKLSRASQLLDQYRKKSQLYGRQTHNVILVPHGNDFRYDTIKETHGQFENLEKLMEYMNSRKDWNVNVRFGTLKDYFELAKTNVGDAVESFSGDFFTYADRGVEYWSGYYTSRPYYKRLDRLVEYYLRSAEIIFSFANILQTLQEEQTGKESNSTARNQLYKQLIVARRNLGIFQHHDGITGTAKAAVVLDYQDKLMQSLKNCKNVIEQSATRLLVTSDDSKDTEAKQSIVFSIDDVQLNSSILIDLSSGQEQTVVIFNPSSNERQDTVSLKVNSPYFEIFDSDGAKITDFQLSLIWDDSDIVSINEHFDSKKTVKMPDFKKNQFELLFLIKLDPFLFKTLRLRPTSDDGNLHLKISQVKNIRINETGNHSVSLSSKNDQKSVEQDKPAQNEEEVLELDANSKAHFSLKTGLLQKIVYQKQTLQTKIEFVQYKSTGGAYLFRPDGPAQNISYSKLLKWVRIEHSGSIRKRVCSHLTVLIHCVDFFPSLDRANQLELPSVRIWNLVDLRRGANDELAMRVTSDIRNERIFYTDLNGFQYIKRKTYLDKLPIQGNVYPMPSGAFIQDDKMRMNLLSGQALGVASLNESTLDVFLDRHLDQDDGRGLGEGVGDNRRTPSRFILQFERMSSSSLDQFDSITISQPSIYSQKQSFDLLNPLIKLVYNNDRQAEGAESQLLKHFSPIPLNKPFPCDLRILNIRTMQRSNEEPARNEVGVILHRLANGDCPASEFHLEDLFAYLKFYLLEDYGFKVKKVLLNMEEVPEEDKTDSKADSGILAHLDPMNINAYRIRFL